MSSEFIQFNFPCIECLVKTCCGTKSKIKPEEIYGHDLLGGASCLAVPEINYNNATYQKALLECWANFGQEIMNALHKIEDPKGVDRENNLPMDYIYLLQSIARILQWIVNSASWEEGKLFDFDKFEVNKVLKNLSI